MTKILLMHTSKPVSLIVLVVMVITKELIGACLVAKETEVL